MYKYNMPYKSLDQKRKYNKLRNKLRRETASVVPTIENIISPETASVVPTIENVVPPEIVVPSIKKIFYVKYI